MQRISIARIVNGTRLIYAWDSLSAAGRGDGRRDRGESESGGKRASAGKGKRGLENLAEYHFFRSRKFSLFRSSTTTAAAAVAALSRGWMRDPEERREEPHAFPFLRERSSVADATRRFSRPVVCQTRDATSHSAFPFPLSRPFFLSVTRTMKRRRRRRRTTSSEEIGVD